MIGTSDQSCWLAKACKILRVSNDTYTLNIWTACASVSFLTGVNVIHG